VTTQPKADSLQTGVATAVLLAAGTGSRFNASGEAIPKCLAEVGGVSILARLFENFSAGGITRVIIVVGFKGALIREAVCTLTKTIEVEFVENPDFATTNNIYSLWLAKEVIKEDFLLVESDLVFDKQLIQAMNTLNCIAVSPVQPWMQGTTVDVGENALVTRFHLASAKGVAGAHKTINVYALSYTSWQRVVERLGQHIKKGNTGSYYELTFSELLDEGLLVFTAVVWPSDQWYEIDTPTDQVAANRMSSLLSA